MCPPGFAFFIQEIRSQGVVDTIQAGVGGKQFGVARESTRQEIIIGAQKRYKRGLSLPYPEVEGGPRPEVDAVWMPEEPDSIRVSPNQLTACVERSVQGSVLNQDDFCHFWLNQGGLDGPCDKGLRIENRNDDRNGKWDGGFHDKPEKWHSETVLAIIEVRNTRRMG